MARALWLLLGQPGLQLAGWLAGLLGCPGVLQPTWMPRTGLPVLCVQCITSLCSAALRQDPT